METGDWNVNPSFDPRSQSFPLFGPDGTTRFKASLADVFLVQQSAVTQSIQQSIQIGAAVILLLTLLLVTKKEKLQSLVFVLNALALMFVALRGIVSLCVYTGPLYNFYRYEANYYQDIGNAKALSAAGEVMAFLLTAAIQIALVLQVKIVCCNLETWKQKFINITNGFVVLTSIAIRFTLMVLNIDWNIANVGSVTQEEFVALGKLASTANIALVISIAISAVIFSGKLWFAIRARRSMGMTQFGPMQTIFVMGCQTMLTPLIFTIIVYWGPKASQVSSFVPTVVAISLPLSAMWATVNTSNTHIPTPHANPRAIPIGNPIFESGKSFGSSKDSTVAHDTLVDDESVGLNSPKKYSAEAQYNNDKKVDNLEMGRVSESRGMGKVFVDRTYSVASGWAT